MERLEAFPDKEFWSIRLRRPLVPLSEADVRMLAPRVDYLAKLPKRRPSTDGGSDR